MTLMAGKSKRTLVKTSMQLLVLLMICGPTLFAQAAARTPLEGVWKVTEIVISGAGAYATTAPQPGLMIFTKSHYSWMWVPGTTPRVLFKSQTPTSEEKVAAFDSVVASSGTYELNGATATFRPIVNRGPNMVSIDEQFQVEGDTLTLTWKSSDTRTRIGQDVVRSTAPASQGRMKLIRVE
jgi:hypothetical protein